MWKNQFKVAVRSIIKNKLFSVINIVGLAIGFASIIIIYEYIQQELSFEKHFKNAGRIYRIAGQYSQGEDGLTTSATTPYQLAPFIEENFDQIEHITRLSFQSRPVKVDEQFILEDDIYYADEAFFEIFDYQFLQGKPTGMLNNPGSVVISREISEKYFLDQNPIGQVIDFSGFSAKVTGVMDQLNKKSHIRPQFVVSMSTIENSLPNWMRTNWGGTSHWTYFLLKEGYNTVGLAEGFSRLVNTTHNLDNHQHHYFLQPIKDIHLYSNINDEITANGNILYVTIFGIIGMVILFVAGINYVNLSTASVTYRLKEVGMRRTMGANKAQMVLQFQIESIIIALLASVLGVLLIEIFTPIFNELVGQNLKLNLYNDWALIGFVGTLAILIGLIAGSFPGLFIMRFDVLDALKGKLDKIGKDRISFRSVLVVIQFTISVILIAGTIVVYKQLNYMKNKDLGIQTEHVIQIPLQSNDNIDQLDFIKQRLLTHPDIEAVGAANNSVTNRVGGWRRYQVGDSNESTNVTTIIVDMDFLSTLGAEIVQGRSFDKNRPADYDKAYMINESAQKFLSLNDPVGVDIEGAVYTGEEWNKKEAKIIGVVKDFNFASLHDEIQPLIFSLQTEQTMRIQNLVVRLKGQNSLSTMTYIEDTWNEISPHRPFIYDYLDEQIAEHYVSEDQFFNLFSIFSTLAIIIGCMGLFGLSVFAVQLRIREIGIRKVLGAQIISLVSMLSWKFIRLVIIANLFAIPVSYYLMKWWLINFAYRIRIDVTPFLLAASLALMIAFLTIIIQTIKSALTNPVETLRNE